MDDQKPTPQPNPDHTPGTGKGEEKLKSEGAEPGRENTGTTGEAKRPSGKTSASGSTGVNPAQENPVDPESPNLPTP